MFEHLGEGVIQEIRENLARGREDSVTSLGFGSGKMGVAGSFREMMWGCL